MTKMYASLDHDITWLDAEYMQPGVAVVYLMRSGDEIAIIETGTTLTVPRILELIESMGLGAESVRYIIPTHVHLDHAGGAGELMHQCPNARLVVHPKGARHLVNPEKLVAGTIAVYGEEKFKRLYGNLRPIDADRVIEAGDNFELDFNGRMLRFIDTPGHAGHHFCIYDALSEGVFTGDTFGLAYADLDTPEGRFIIATTTPVQFNPDALLSSINRIMSFNPKYCFLTHFGPIEPTGVIVERLIESVKATAQIGLDEKESPDGRHARMRDRLMTNYLDQLKAMNCTQSEEYCRAKLANDADLNAQGLDVWLSRMSS